MLTVIILTKNEERHIERAICSVKGVADRCVVVDSGSDDNTVELARSNGATVFFNPWVNHATQFNWAIEQLPEDTEWILRLDADEIITDVLRREIAENLKDIPENIDGIYISRRLNFLGSPVRFGGLYPIRIIRIFRFRRGRCEDRWMDEHILVSGPTADFAGDIVDDNLNSLTWWTQKHNAYASLEVVELLNLQYGFLRRETVASIRSGRQSGIKRWFKEVAYANLPGGVRAFIYFSFRFFVCFGFLDGREGRAFHILQGFWYRYVVDVKLKEVKSYMRKYNKDPISSIRDVLGIDIQG